MELSNQQELKSETSDTLTTPLISPTDDDDDSHPKQAPQRQRWSWKVILEATIMSFFLLVLWGVYAAVPTVLYVLKPVHQVYNYFL